jgi:hypothetical protein
VPGGADVMPAAGDSAVVQEAHPDRAAGWLGDGGRDQVRSLTRTLERRPLAS